MTTAELRLIRKRWELTQEDLATRMGVQRRAYIAIETGQNPIRKAHILVLERISIDIAVQRHDRSLLLSPLRYVLDHLLALEEVDQSTSRD